MHCFTTVYLFVKWFCLIKAKINRIILPAKTVPRFIIINTNITNMVFVDISSIFRDKQKVLYIMISLGFHIRTFFFSLSFKFFHFAALSTNYHDFLMVFNMFADLQAIVKMFFILVNDRLA